MYWTIIAHFLQWSLKCGYQALVTTKAGFLQFNIEHLMTVHQNVLNFLGI